MKIFNTLIFIVVFQFVSGQDISVKISNLYKNKDSILLTVTLENISNGRILIFKPDVNYVNYGLLAINLIDQSNISSGHYDYGKRGDLDKLILEESDYLILNEKETYSKRIQLFTRNFAPTITKGFYKLQFTLDYTFINLEFPCKVQSKIFKGKVSTISTTKIGFK